MGVFSCCSSLRFAVPVILLLFVLALLSGFGVHIERLWLVPGIPLAFGVFAYAGKIWQYRRASAFFHLGLGIVILGGLVSWADRKSSEVSVVAGDTVQVAPPWLSPLSFTFQTLTKEYWPDGSLRDWRAAVLVRPTEGDSIAGTITANEPLAYQNSNIYLLKRGRAAIFQLCDASGRELGRVAFLFDAEKADTNEIYFPHTIIKIKVGIPELGSSEPLAVALYSRERLFGETRMSPGVWLPCPGGVLRCKELTEWGIFTVIEDRGKPLVWLGFAVIFAGLVGMLIGRSVPHDAE